MMECEACSGDGIERCDNPDHGILNMIRFRGASETACPCCGHDEQYRMGSYKRVEGMLKLIWNNCPECSGTGKQPPEDKADD